MKSLIVLRGLPGAGKSTLAEVLSAGIHPIACADDYFMVDGEYKFDARKLGEAHANCRNRVEVAMQTSWLNSLKFDYNINEDPYRTIIVANTNTVSSEWYDFYSELAEKYGYQIHSVIVENRHGNKSIHNVPEETMERMRNRFEVKL